MPYPSHDPAPVGTPVDGDALRAVMRRLPTPVTIITVRGEAELRGITIGSFTSTSLEPPLVSFNVDRAAQMHDVLLAAPRYAVHVLSASQAALSDRFALPDRTGAEQFEGVAYHVDRHGTPLLEGVLAVLHCIPYAAYDAGDHTIFVGEVVEVEAGPEGEPLLYFNRAYRRVGEPVALPGFVGAPVNRSSSGSPEAPAPKNAKS